MLKTIILYFFLIPIFGLFNSEETRTNQKSLGGINNSKMNNVLSDYSYYLAYVDSNGNIFGNATGFLFRKNGATFLITNVHVLFGVNVSDLSPQEHLVKYKNFKISLRYKKKDGSMNLFDIGIDKNRHQYSKLLFPKMLDIFSYQLPALPIDGQFYCINDDFEIDADYKCNELVAYGYPARDHFQEEDYRNRICKNSTGVTIDEPKENGRRINTTLLIEQGMSGSPIFSIKEVGDSKITKFYGIGDGYDPDTKTSIITHLFASVAFRSFFVK